MMLFVERVSMVVSMSFMSLQKKFMISLERNKMVHNIKDERIIDLLKNKMKGQKLVYIYRILDLIGLCFNKYGIAPM